MMPPAIMGARGWRRIWSEMSDPRSASLPERVTMMPIAVEISRAGICAARPSPMVSSGKTCGGLAERHAALQHADADAAERG